MVKEKKPLNADAAQTPAVRKARIYTMPDKFYVSDAGGSSKKSPLLLIMVIVLAVVVIGGGAFILYQRMNTSTDEIANQSPENLNTSLVVNSNTNQIVNQQTNSPANTNRLTTANTNSGTNGVFNLNTANVNVFQNTNTTSNSNVSTITRSEDTDGDGLTNVEESLYGTSITVADTDGDGYADGQEVLAGYDPNSPGQPLSSSSAVKLYTNVTDGYSLLYPSGWDVANDTQNSRGKLFTTSGEFVSVSLQDNPAQLSARDWYLSKAPGIDFTAVKSVVTWDGTLSGVQSVDGTTVYLTRGTSVYVISYNTNILSEANYMTTFQMMYQSMSTVSASANTNVHTNSTNTNSATNTNGNGNANQL